MRSGRNTQSFLIGAGEEPQQYCCAECGYASENRKHFRNTEDGGAKTCSTGHYEKDGELKRARNPYAGRR
jgi:hypothetical protein